MSRFSEWLTAEFEASGLSQEDFAKKLGVGQQQDVHRYTAGVVIPRAWKTIARSLDADQKFVRRLIYEAEAGKLRKTLKPHERQEVEAEIAAERVPRLLDIDEPGNVSAIMPIRMSAKPMPILGRAAGGDDGCLIMDGSVSDWVSRPIELETVDEAYGVVVYGDSMKERYRHGFRLNVNPRKKYHPGDGVVVQVDNRKTGEWSAYIKEFVRETSDELVLRQYNPPKELHFKGNEIRHIHRVDGTVEP